MFFLRGFKPVYDYIDAQVAALTTYIDEQDAVQATYTDEQIAALTTYIDEQVATKGTCSMKVGTYQGDGTDNRNIDIGVDLASKTIAFVILKVDTNIGGVHKSNYVVADTSMYFIAESDVPNLIQSFSATGFVVGSNDAVNKDGYSCRYEAFWVD